METTKIAVGPLRTIVDHALLTTLFLHLAPGVLIFLFYLASAPLLMARGYPPVAAMLLAIAIVAIPLELGELIRRGLRQNGRLSLRGVVTLRGRMPAWQVLVFTLGFLLAALLISAAASPIDNLLASALSGWLPGWFFLQRIESYAGYSRSVLQTVLIVNLLLNGLAAPLVEELYFRGFLLPRLAGLGRWAPLVNALLFTLYHFWQLYAYPSIFLTLLPLIWLTWRKQNIYLAIFGHSTINILGNLVLFAAILGK
jgi:hypothetical protein